MGFFVLSLLSIIFRDNDLANWMLWCKMMLEVIKKNVFICFCTWLNAFIDWITICIHGKKVFFILLNIINPRISFAFICEQQISKNTWFHSYLLFYQLFSFQMRKIVIEFHFIIFSLFINCNRCVRNKNKYIHKQNNAIQVTLETIYMYFCVSALISALGFFLFFNFCLCI